MTGERKCIGCGCLKNSAELIKITVDSATKDIFVNPNTKTFGRSAYLCYNKMCIENALKKNRLQKALKTQISEELKGQLIGFE